VDLIRDVAKDDVFTEKHTALRKRWACDKHSSSRECWRPAFKPYGGKQCISLSAWHLDAWATAIKEGRAGLNTPPLQMKEFQDLLEKSGNASRTNIKQQIYAEQNCNGLFNSLINFDRSFIQAVTREPGGGIRRICER